MPDALGLGLQNHLQGLRYTLLLNVLGFRYLYEAGTQDLCIHRDTIVVPCWFLMLVGSALQLPGLLYLYIGYWSATQVAR